MYAILKVAIDLLSYMDNKVFVSLKNGHLAIFKRIYCKV